MVYLKKITYQYTKPDGTVQQQSREAYDRGNGAVILLYNIASRTVILTRQFRIPTYINGNESGMLIEACAGLLDQDSPQDCIRRETEEETGYQIKEAKKYLKRICLQARLPKFYISLSRSIRTI
ncbi:NUDIX domain-containing protein [Sphingobacterium sp. E70]|uniref:NUDIX domain-containing protein n=1 Tax=Sphingobacterium sp. E70 TaxID=2853439 RepID=UPI00211B8983|nr:NUDIX domain-containing protein [Sphingobacterium sp. E70]